MGAMDDAQSRSLRLTLIRKLTESRDRDGQTAQQLESNAGLKRHTLFGLALGLCPLDLETLAGVCNALKVEPAELLPSLEEIETVLLEGCQEIARRDRDADQTAALTDTP